jgi:hypothetical protein
MARGARRAGPITGGRPRRERFSFDRQLILGRHPLGSYGSKAFEESAPMAAFDAEIEPSRAYEGAVR